MVNGDICPVCPERIDFINCCEVGICDGAGNLLYAANRWGSSTLANILVGIYETNFFRFFLQESQYLRILFDNLQTDNPDLADRQEFCFYLTIGSIALPIFLLVLLASLILFILPPLIDLFVACVVLLTTNPIWEAVVNGGESQGYFEIPGEGDTPVLEDDEEDEFEDQEDQMDNGLEFSADRINRRLTARRNATWLDALTSWTAYALMDKEKKE